MLLIYHTVTDVQTKYKYCVRDTKEKKTVMVIQTVLHLQSSLHDFLTETGRNIAK